LYGPKDPPEAEGARKLSSASTGLNFFGAKQLLQTFCFILITMEIPFYLVILPKADTQPLNHDNLSFGPHHSEEPYLKL
jgi:hypothetical protein